METVWLKRSTWSSVLVAALCLTIFTAYRMGLEKNIAFAIAAPVVVALLSVVSRHWIRPIVVFGGIVLMTIWVAVYPKWGYFEDPAMYLALVAAAVAGPEIFNMKRPEEVEDFEEAALLFYGIPILGFVVGWVAYLGEARLWFLIGILVVAQILQLFYGIQLGHRQNAAREKKNAAKRRGKKK